MVRSVRHVLNQFVKAKNRTWLFLSTIAIASFPILATAQDSVVVFNEIHYHPENGNSALEYVELYNQLAVEIDISNWRIDGDIDFDFPEGTIIPSHGYLVIAKDPSAWAAATGSSDILGPFNRSLSNSGDTITLYNNNRSFRSLSGSGSTGAPTDDLAARRIMDQLDYSDSHPWPEGPDGSGFTLAKREAQTGTAHPENWTTSNQINGTPGTENLFTSLPSLAFNEVTSSLSPNFQLELFNYGNTPIPLEGLVISSSNELSPDYLFPLSSLPAGSFLIIDENTLGFNPTDNDRLFLLSADKSALINTVRVDDSAVARTPDGTGSWARPTSLTIGAANEVLIEDGLIINEIFYNAKPQIAEGNATRTSLPVLGYGSNWRYNLNAGTNGLPSNWASNSHVVDNVNWSSGPGLLGLENSNLGQPIQTNISLTGQITYYFETDFNYDDTDAVTELVINHYIDDGAIFYLNGVEIGRFNMGPGGVTPTTVAALGVGNASLQTLTVPSPNILTGSNRLSVEVHQVGTNSSDVVFGANVSLTIEAGNSIPYAERAEEWIELYNRSNTTIDLTNWKLGGGINFSFPPATSIASGDYLVIAKDAPALLIKHPSIPIIGDYSGQLGNGGDLILLEDPNGNIADKVEYFDSGQWHPEADGGGSSLELRDPRSDNTLASSWAPSNENSRNTWQTYIYEGVAIDDGMGFDTFHELQVGLLDAGEFLLDDVSIIENNSTQFVQNADFENDNLGGSADKWRTVGTHGSHGKTMVIADPDDPSNQCLHVVATGPTENRHNKIETTFANNEQVVEGKTYRITFRAKWLSGSNQLNTKFYFNYLQETHILDSAEVWGTPGTINTAASPNTGPDLSGLTHFPVVPDANQAVTVSIDASDPDDIQSLELFYSINDGAYQTITMTAANEHFTATIPGQNSSDIVRFYVQATDNNNAISHYPKGSTTGGAFYKVQDGLADTSGLRHNFRIIMAESDRSFLFLNTNRMSNDRFPVTIIENEETVYYNAQLRLKASAHGRYQSNGYGFNIRFQPDQLFRGVHQSLSVERGALARQFLAKSLMNRAGGGYWSFYDDVAHIITPTVGDRGVALLSLSRHTSSFWDGLFPDSDENGTLFNLELHYEPTTTTGGPEALKRGNPFSNAAGRYRLENRGDNKEPYRWGYQIRSARDRDDYSPIIALSQAVSELSGNALKEALDPLIDVNQWMRTFAMLTLNGTDDVYTRIWEHNFRFFVRPTDGKIIVLQWDIDRAFRVGANSSVIPTVNGIGITYPVAKVFTIPEYRRIFDGHMNDLVETTFNSAYVVPLSNGLSTAIGSNVNFTNYITNRANFALSTLPNSEPFEITTNGGSDFSEPDSVIELAGTGSYDVFSIEINGLQTPITWIGANNWTITTPINLGPNTLTLSAKNNQGVEISNDTITVTNTSDIDLANANNTIVSEFHYHPSSPNASEQAEGFLEDDDFEFIELMNISSTFVDYTGVNFTSGITFTIPANTVLGPGERLILVRNQDAFEFRNGASLARIAGEYSGRLSNGGERIRLAAADTTTIVDFTYSDDFPWPESSDGDGFSLVFRGFDVNNPADWRPSTTENGNPGNSDSIPFTGNDLLEYLLVDGPNLPLVNDSIFIEFSVYSAADDATFEVQFSEDLLDWTTATEEELHSQTENSDGTTTYLYAPPAPTGDGSSHFGRIKVEAR